MFVIALQIMFKIISIVQSLVSYSQAPVTTTLEPRWLQDRTLSMLRLTIELELLVSKIISNLDLEISDIQMHK